MCNVFSTEDFTVHGKELVSCVSDIFGYAPLQRSFYIKSHKTGRIEAFTFSRRELDVEGDTVCFTYLPVSEELYLRHVKVKLFND